jgi:hypothetical protein
MFGAVATRSPTTGEVTLMLGKWDKDKDGALNEDEYVSMVHPSPQPQPTATPFRAVSKYSTVLGGFPCGPFLNIATESH